MTEPNVRTPDQCAQAQLDAYNARDIERFAAVYTDDIELIDLSSGEVFCAGKPALIERYGPMFAERTQLHCHLVRRIVCPPFVIDEEEVSGLRPDGIVHAVATYECANGLIRRAWFIRETTP